MSKFYLIPVDISEEVGKSISLTTEQIKKVVLEYCKKDNNDIFIIDAIPYIVNPSAERFSSMHKLAENFAIDEDLEGIEVHVAIDDVKYSKFAANYGYKILCTRKIREDLNLKEDSYILIDEILK